MKRAAWIVSACLVSIVAFEHTALPVVGGGGECMIHGYCDLTRTCWDGTPLYTCTLNDPNCPLGFNECVEGGCVQNTCPPAPR